MITIGGKDIADIVIDNKNVVKIQDAITLDIMWVKRSPSNEYFYIENDYNGNNTISITTSDTGTTTGNHASQLEYSKDKENWTTITLSGTNRISMNSGEKVYFRNNNGYFNWYNNMSDAFITTITCSETHSVGGNINTLLDYTNDNVSCSTGCFYQLFVDNSKLTNAENLSLPATNLANLCYTQMFYLCSSLTTAPALPATTLASSCYEYMFQNCTLLTTAPELPATTLASNCYYAMFQGCTSLVNAPTLPATTLASNCYYSMFQSCNSLTSAALPATTLADNCYRQMFNGCTSLTTAPALPATTLAENCYRGMFAYCTSLTTAPALPATTLVSNCYGAMFNGCTSLVNAPTLPATTLVNYCYQNMFNGCTSLNKVTTYANDISATGCITKWLNNVAASGTFYNYGSASYTYPSASGIPQGWQEVIPKEYFYIENKYNGTNTITLTTDYTNYPNAQPPQGTYATSVEYSKDMGSWTTINFRPGYPSTIIMNSGERVYFRNDSGYFNYTINVGTQSSKYYRTTFSCDQSFVVGGNLCSLLDYNNMNSVTLSTGCFSGLFRNNYDTLTGASDLILNKNTLSYYCYAYMFSECHNLTSIPELPAKNLAERCYQNMFAACSHLNVFPELPATTLSNYCYYNMFRDCDRFNKPVVLPATTLTDYCYSQMFRATKVNNVTSYANDISATSCLDYFLYNSSSTGTFHNLGTATYPIGWNGIPSGWTVVYS